MANTIVLENLLQKETIKLKDKLTVIKQVANTKYQGDLKQQGDTVTVQTFPNHFGNMGGTAGDDITLDDWAITGEQLTVDQVFQNGAKVKDIEEVQSNLSLIGQLSNRYAFSSALNEDQYIASFFTDALTDNKAGNQSPISLGVSNTYSTVTDLKRRLSEQNAFQSRMLFVSPAIHEKFRLENILDSSNLGLETRLNGEVGRIDGFRVMETNNLPHVITHTVDTQPTNGDTFSITGRIKTTSGTGGYANQTVTFTIVTAGTASSAGDISLGATLADTQANIVNAINGTGTPGASTYIEISAANRVALKNGFVQSTAFTSNVATIRSAITMPTAETYTAGTNVFGSDAVLMAAVDMEAINYVSQMDKFKVRDREQGFAANILQERVYGGKVFAENSKGIATAEIAV